MEEENETTNAYIPISPYGDDPSCLMGIMAMAAGIVYFIVSLLII